MHEIKKLILERNEKIKGKYVDKTHTYTINGKELISVTTLKKKYFPFDIEHVAKRCAIFSKGKKTKEEFIEEWNESAIFGTHIHKLIQNYVNGEELSKLELNQIYHVIRFLEITRFKHIASEIQIYSPSLGLAGTIDWICEDKEGRLWIIDWKTSKTITEKSVDKANYPINHLDHCKINEFSFQTGIYAFILNSEYKLPKKILSLGILQINLNKTYKFYSTENGKLPNLEKEIIQALFNHEELNEF